jgi:hypothetical protein
MDKINSFATSTTTTVFLCRALERFKNVLGLGFAASANGLVNKADSIVGGQTALSELLESGSVFDNATGEDFLNLRTI